jgi:transposase
MGINGLSVLVEATLKYDPFSRNLFCFVNKRRSQIKGLYWQQTGFCLWLKRLEEERFRWPFHLEGPVIDSTRSSSAGCSIGWTSSI